MKFEILITIKIVVLIIGISAMFFSSFLGLGSYEDWQAAINFRFWEFFFSRLGLTFLVGLFFLSIDLFVSILYWQEKKIDKLKIKKLIILEVILTFIISILLVGFTIC